MEIRKERKGVEPVGQNGTLWKSIQKMKEMFRRGKLLRGTVPPRNLKKNKEEKENDNQQPMTSKYSTKNMEKMSGTPGTSGTEVKDEHQKILYFNRTKFRK